MANDVFGSGDNLNDIDPIQYVTERYKNEAGEIDLAKVAKAIVEKDKHIKNVESEAGELRAEVKTRIGLEEFLTKVNQPKNEDRNPPGNPPQQKVDEPPVDIEKLVETHLSTVEANRAKAANRAKVNETLEKIWGSDAAKNLDKVSRDIGMPKTDLQVLAERSPEAFFRVTGINRDNPAAPVGVPGGTVNLNGNQNGQRNQAYYRELKKTNPKLYFDTKTQMQMHRDAEALGAKFFN